MEQKKVKTQIKLSDGRVIPAVPFQGKDSIPPRTRRLAEQARLAGVNAIRELHAAGIPAFYERDGKLVKFCPDGHEEVVKELQSR